MTDPPDTPSLPRLREIVAALEAASIPCALGGSGLLLASGLAETARDWDLTTDAPLERVRAALAPHAPEEFGPSGVHADHKLVIDGGAIEVIVGHSMRAEAGVVRLPTLLGARWNGVPLGSLEVWAVAYALLGREAKSERVLVALAERGAEARAIELMLAQPLPFGLAERMERLPRRTR